MIVDSHVHLGSAPEAKARGQIPTRFLSGELIQIMDRNNIDISVVFAYGRLHDKFHRHNQTVCDAVIEHPSRLVGFVRPNPWYEESLLDIDLFVGEWGFKGIVRV